MAPRARVGAGQAPQPARRDRLEQDSRDAVPETEAVPLAGVVEERGRKQVGILMAGSEEALRDVESMTAVGDRHPREQLLPPRRQDAFDERHLGRVDARPYVRDELPDPMHRSGPQ